MSGKSCPSHRRPTRFVTIGTLLSGLLVASGPAPAVTTEDLRGSITFEVPVRITNVAPEMRRLIVSCYLSGNVLISRFQFDGRYAMGRGTTDVDLTGHSYNGVVRVPITFNDVYRPEMLRSYRCDLSIVFAPYGTNSTDWLARDAREYYGGTGHTDSAARAGDWHWDVKANYTITPR